jgi:hypothetical protein
MSQSNPEVQWDLNGAEIYTSNVANSSAGAEDVVLNFGTTQRPSEASPELSVKLVRKIALRPQTARTLRDMLRDVIADIDADRMRRR